MFNDDVAKAGQVKLRVRAILACSKEKVMQELERDRERAS